MADRVHDGRALAAAAPDDPQVTITLPLGAWSIITAHPQAGVYHAVAQIISNIADQAIPQIAAAQRAHAAEQARLAQSAESAPSAARPH